MSIFQQCIKRPIATCLLALGLTLLGSVAYFQLPVAPLPQVEYPTISVQASLPGASPETIAATVATPLERALGSIAGVSEITSTSSLGSTRIIIQFDLSRSIDSAGREVQAAINASKAQLPSGMPSPPTYRKVNPADSPIMVLALSSPQLNTGDIADIADTYIAQRLAQVEGVGQVQVGGGTLPAIRIATDLNKLAALRLNIDEVRQAIVASNLNRPKGNLESEKLNWQITANDQIRTEEQYQQIIISNKNGQIIRLSDLGRVYTSLQDVRSGGMANGKAAVMILLYRQPEANIIATVDRIKAILPRLQNNVPSNVNVEVMMDRTPTIRASMREVERTLLISVILVVLVVYLFFGSIRAAVIPCVVVPVSLIATFASMWICGFSLNILSLMALTVATGFVVDDAIVVLENSLRHIEAGQKPLNAALISIREVGFTVVAISISLIAVFVPIIFMGGILGRLFIEFALTLSLAILFSLLISLTLTPVMCAYLLPEKASKPNLISAKTQQFFNFLQNHYAISLRWSLKHKKTLMFILLVTIIANVLLYINVAKGFFPQQDSGRLMGMLRADQASSFQAIYQYMEKFSAIVRRDPAVENVVVFTGGSQRNSAFMFVTLKPLKERDATADQIISRMRRSLGQVAGANLFLQSAQDIRVGGRPGAAQYQYTLQADDFEILKTWEPKIRRALSEIPQITDVNTDQEDRGQQITLKIDRDLAASLGINQRQISNTLNNLFGQRIISTIYNPLNQYRVVLEAENEYLQSPEALKNINIVNSAGNLIPLSTFSSWQPSNAPISINHQNQFAASTISFNLSPGQSLSDATSALKNTMDNIGTPKSIQAGFQGAAKAFQSSLSSQPILILSALIVVYLVLGMLYESLIHPLTILSTLPSAGVGAISALILLKLEFTVIALIAVFLLIGIVKKNAILMIDFAIAQERKGINAEEAIYQACNWRFRPIMMTTLAAIFGALPLALGSGDGAELRQPLGVAIVGGLFISQLLTLYTTPVVYLLLNRFTKKKSESKNDNKNVCLANSQLIDAA